MSALLEPLRQCLERQGRVLPAFELLNRREVPAPYSRLLVHESDMTSTLEQYFGDSVEVEVVHKDLQADEVLREVVLRTTKQQTPTEYGAIRIALKDLPKLARQEVLAGRNPLGGILRTHAVPYVSAPDAFFKITAEAEIGRLLALSGMKVLYGRQNTLRHRHGGLLAQAVEILPRLSEEPQA